MSAGGGAPPVLTSYRRIGQIELMHALHIAADGLGAERHGAVDPGADPGRAAALDIAAKAGGISIAA